jgi:type VI secretion system protein VasG
MIDAILTNTVLPVISKEILTRMMESKPITRIATTVVEGELHFDFD